MLQLFLIMLSFLVIFGGLLYIITHKLVSVWRDEKVKKRTIAIWCWRATLVVILLFLVAIIFLNQVDLFLIFSSEDPIGLALIIFVFVLFVSIIEIAIIDMLLPDVVRVWKRILIESLALGFLVVTTFAIFALYSFSV